MNEVTLATEVKTEHHPAIELLRLFIEKYEKMEPEDRFTLLKAINLLCEAPAIIHTR